MTTARSRMTAHLVGTGEAEPVQQRDENVRRDEQPEDVSTADEPVLRAVGVDLCRNADDGHGGLEGGDERQRDREAAHAPVRHQELLRGSLPAAGHGVVQPDARRGRQQQAKDDVIRHHEERAFLSGFRSQSGGHIHQTRTWRDEKVLPETHRNSRFCSGSEPHQPPSVNKTVTMIFSNP